MAVLHVFDGDSRIEVRGHRGVGTRWTGDRLDRVLSGLPKTVNVSALFADDQVGLRSHEAETMRALLAREEEIVASIMLSHCT